MAKKRRLPSEFVEEFSRIVEALIKDSASGVPIVVEGMRDVRALRKMGVRGEVVVLKSFKGLREGFEGRQLSRIILLLDLDSEGDRMTTMAKKALEGVVKNVDTSYRIRLKKFKGLGLTEIEALPTLFERMFSRA